MKGFFCARGIKGAIYCGAFACLIHLVATFVITVFLTRTLSGILLNIMIACVWGGLTFGILKKSRVSAGLALFIYIAMQLSLLVNTGFTRFNFLWPFFIFSFSHAVIATRLFHKMKQAEAELSHRLWKETGILTALMLIIFFGSFPACSMVRERLEQKAWREYVQLVGQQKEDLRLPVRVVNGIYLRDIYFEEKTLVFEYETTHLKSVDIPAWYDLTRQDFSRFCAGEINMFSHFQVIYRLTQGYKKQEFTFSIRDCRY